MGKELVGYKLKDKFYKNGHTYVYSAAVYICGMLDGQIKSEAFAISKSSAIDAARHAGVLKEWFEPVYKKSFEFGKWYKSKDGAIFFIESETKWYGLNAYREDWIYVDGNGVNIEKDFFEQIEKEEAEEIILEYAKKHYPIGTRFKSLATKGEGTVEKYSFNYAYEGGGFWIYAEGGMHPNVALYIFANGKWADKLESELYVSGNKKVIFYDDLVTIGEVSIHSSWIMQARELISLGGLPVTIRVGDIELKDDEIKIIAKHFKLD